MRTILAAPLDTTLLHITNAPRLRIVRCMSRNVYNQQIVGEMIFGYLFALPNPNIKRMRWACKQNFSRQAARLLYTSRIPWDMENFDSKFMAIWSAPARTKRRIPKMKHTTAYWQCVQCACARLLRHKSHSSYVD